MIRTRFAPSPTGKLHVGVTRTALYNFLYSRKNKGKFILRVEDTDIERSTKESEEQLINSLTWLGLDWDEGPKVGGDYGPYRQSERSLIYEEKVKELLEKGLAYEAYITTEELNQIKEDLLEEGKSIQYNEKMLKKYNTEERINESKMKGLKPVVFFKMPIEEYTIQDVIKGEVTFKKGSVGDFVIMRSNGQPTYNFAVTVDDMLMEITHVLRGDDHLSNTLRQIVLYEAFDYKAPQFAHLSMILGPDGKKLSKRHGSTSVEEFKSKGYLPETIINYLALLGWSHPEEKELISINEMINHFDFTRVNSSSAIFDEVKMKWMNSHYIRNADLGRLYNLSIPFIINNGLLNQEQCKNNKKWLLEALDLVKISAETLEDIPVSLKTFIEDFSLDIEENELKEYLNAKNIKLSLKKCLENLQNDEDWTSKTVLENLKSAMIETKPDKKAFYQALRKIVTNKYHGPDLVKSIHLVGRARTIERLEKVVQN